MPVCNLPPCLAFVFAWLALIISLSLCSHSPSLAFTFACLLLPSDAKDTPSPVPPLTRPPCRIQEFLSQGQNFGAIADLAEIGMSEKQATHPSV